MFDAGKRTVGHLENGLLKMRYEMAVAGLVATAPPCVHK